MHSVTRGPEDNRLHRARTAVTLAQQGEHDSATDIVIDLVTEDPDCAVAHRAWGRVLLEQGRATDAVAAYKAAVALAPDEAALQFELAYALVAQAEKSPFVGLTSYIEAKDAVEAGLHRDPDNTLAPGLIDLIDAGRHKILS